MLSAYCNLPKSRVIGLISGTSADAIDAALVEIEGRTMRLLRFVAHPYPEDLRSALFELFEDRATVRTLARVHFRLGRHFAEAAQAVAQGEAVDLVASHGQTVAHLPGEATLQIGEASYLAEAFGTPVVSDFRPADLILGGQAAPLVPFFDHWLLHSPEVDRAAINIGGMANISWVPAQGTVRGWDSGPGNVVMDALAERFLHQPADFGGRFATQGKVDQVLLDEMLAHPYFHETGPKSTGRELFGRDWIEPFLYRAQPQDLMRTAAALTAESLARSLRPHLGGSYELVVGGGGYHNLVLMEELRQRLADTKLRSIDGFERFGISADAREACAFALMGHETLHGRPSALPSVTGASRAAILGRISPPTPR